VGRTEEGDETSGGKGVKYSEVAIIKCPSGCGGTLSDDGHDGNKIVQAEDGRIGIFYGDFFEGNWSPTPVGCYSCGKFYSLPDLQEVPFGKRLWILRKRDDEDESLKTPTGGYYTSKHLEVHGV
jgi:hypothetical protein